MQLTQALILPAMKEEARHAAEEAQVLVDRNAAMEKELNIQKSHVDEYKHKTDALHETCASLERQLEEQAHAHDSRIEALTASSNEAWEKESRQSKVCRLFKHNLLNANSANYWHFRRAVKDVVDEDLEIVLWVPDNECALWCWSAIWQYPLTGKCCCWTGDVGVSIREGWQRESFSAAASEVCPGKWVSWTRPACFLKWHAARTHMHT